MLQRIKSKVKEVVFEFVKPPVTIQHNSYSQAGEDSILNFLFETMGIRKPSYIDIGANKPDYGNNTYRFYLEGCTGICIEPDSSLYNVLRRVRPNDKVLNIAVGYDGQSEADFYIFDEPSLNTMSEEEALRRDAIGQYRLIEKRTVKVQTMASIIDEHCDELPTFVSLDIEGIDFDILKSFDFEKYPIPIFIVETIDYSTSHIKVKNQELIKYMQESGYFVYADTYVNSIFVNLKWFTEHKNA